MDTPCQLVLCTCPDADSAGHIATVLVGEGLAACANLVPGVVSVYRWQGAVQRDAEVLMLLKTRADAFEALAARLRELHPYTVPEIIAVGIEAGSPAYIGWLLAETRAGGPA
ncbi:divalent-cation tolerance protein CutA [Plasticicumulans sp.]|uniref:divalent-cation tolerance protein CutA n=1 Tax=Plasticicumulans sp. TaxID=2307179 RepID=UPI000F9F3B33|nr:divalent-cation tolerance protein CutA [Plasticicumulans sp.]RTK97155.1 MAG: divalent-cation tolerance protein CutA [Xanthomonadales bacterium]HMW43495.1 divalent-cation tolerance protein CutA [Plasticicumulans sp.]HMZ12461.1 divalent-cation tolerance protein CutA [Plasticicumulans sp.]HND99095.1 divalent-cation tolerance protein CutA [Plasticicumulans sp.]HNE00767.1 divalent-cation tolerance protein CutA [Plasticicumulans sp.]